LTGTIDAILSPTLWLAPSEKAAYCQFVVTENNEGMDDALRMATRLRPTIRFRGFYRNTGISDGPNVEAEEGGTTAE